MYRLTQTTQRENVKSFQALEKQGSLEVVGCQGVMAGEKEAIVKTANWVPELPLFSAHMGSTHLSQKHGWTSFMRLQVWGTENA